ncbi:MAG: ArsR/SmtB family transcription factor [Nocardioidaceae bacterium]
MAGYRDVVTLSDPRALRALAHPARQALLKELFGGRVLTATEAAELVGLTPSAVSHHLRALQKWGLAERADATGDARQRPWRSTGTTLRMEASDLPGSLAALQSLTAGVLQEVSDEIDAYLAAQASDPWRDSYQGLTRAELHLTQEEAARLRGRLEELLEEFDLDRSERDRPAGARRSGLTMSLVPLEPPPG